MLRPLVMLAMAASALAHDMHEIGHVHANGRLCGADERPKHKNGARALDNGDCSATSTDPKLVYSPRSGPVYRINTCVHVIMSSDGESGAASDACVSGGIDWLNRDFRAMAGKGSESVDTRIEFRLIKTKTHKKDAWYNQGTGEGGYWTAAKGKCDPSRAANIFLKATSEGLFGWATLAYNADYSSTDGVTVKTSAWGPCASLSPYDLGGTATHEMGHYLGLLHTFSSGSCSAQTPGCYTSGDTICDTNPQKKRDVQLREGLREGLLWAPRALGELHGLRRRLLPGLVHRGAGAPHALLAQILPLGHLCHRR